MERKPPLRTGSRRSRAPSVCGSEFRRRAMLPNPAAPVELESDGTRALPGLGQDRRSGISVQAQLEHRVAASLSFQAADRVGYTGVQAVLDVGDPQTDRSIGLHHHGGVSAVRFPDGFPPDAWVTALGTSPRGAVSGAPLDSSSRITGDRQGRATPGLTFADARLETPRASVGPTHRHRLRPDLHLREI